MCDSIRRWPLACPDDLSHHWQLFLWALGRAVSLCSSRHPLDLIDSPTCTFDQPTIDQLKQEQVSRGPASKCSLGNQLFDGFRLPSIQKSEDPLSGFPILQQTTLRTIASLPDCPPLLEIDDLATEGHRPLVPAKLIPKNAPKFPAL
jgi:hypothetical protein